MSAVKASSKKTSVVSKKNSSKGTRATSSLSSSKSTETVVSSPSVVQTTQPVTSLPLRHTQGVKKSNNPISQIASALVGEGRELRKYWSIVEEIISLESSVSSLSDEQLKAKTFEFRAKLEGLEKKELDAKLKEILPEAFAVVREASHRAVGMKHFPVQLIGGMVLNDGRIAEMKTGEGKTLVATLAVYLNALPSKNQVHLVTVNDYLARRDASWMGRIYDFLGLTVGIIQNQASFRFKLGASSTESDDKKREMGLVDTLEDGEMEKKTVLDVENLIPVERKSAYWDDESSAPVDIVYGVNSEFGFDYLRDNMAQTPEEVTQKAGLKVAIVDEVDSILIDEARTPLIISSQAEDASDLYRLFAEVAQKLNPATDYEVDEKRKIVTLTDLGVEKVERLLKIDNLYGSAENVKYIHHLDLGLRAFALFKNEKEYVARGGEIVIVDENTGRLMFGRRFNQGLHQAIEAKEGLPIKAESKTVATITFQNFFRMYDKLAGMTGTAATESEELFKIYKLLVVTIPTNKLVVRLDHSDKVFKSEAGKFQALVKDIKEIHKTGQPILIGTTSIEKNLLLGQMLTAAGVEHQVLNAKNHEQEARIVSSAGKKGAVTLATNIAGRGVDIKLGGEIPEDAKKYDQWKKEHDEVKALGGLFVIGTERHESRRIDNQLRGRGGRQGDPGASQFYISLEDFILRVFGGDRIGYFKILPIPEDEPLQHGLLNTIIEQAQKKIEGQHYDSRKHVTDYDDVINRQRQVVYARRQKVLLNDGFNWKDEVENTLYREVLRALSTVPKKQSATDRATSLKQSNTDLKAILPLTDFDSDVLEVLLKDNKFDYKKIAQILVEKLEHQLKTRWEIYQENVQQGLARFVFLRAIDMLWTEHLVTVDHLNDSVRFRGYSQKDPLTEFKQDGMDLFIRLLEEIDKEISNTVFKVSPELVPVGIMKSSK